MSWSINISGHSDDEAVELAIVEATRKFVSELAAAQPAGISMATVNARGLTNDLLVGGFPPGSPEAAQVLADRATAEVTMHGTVATAEQGPGPVTAAPPPPVNPSPVPSPPPEGPPF